MNQPQGKIQLGKNGITENFIILLKTLFKTHGSMKISVLKSARPEKSKVKEYLDKILSELGEHYTAKMIGFTIVVKKWRKPPVSKIIEFVLGSLNRCRIFFRNMRSRREEIS
jgi:RNA-binding protein YhbY